MGRQSRLEVLRRAAGRSRPERIPIIINTWKGVWRKFPDLLSLLRERGLDDIHYDYTDYYGWRDPAAPVGVRGGYTTPFGAEVVSLDGDDLGQAVEHVFADGFEAMTRGAWVPPEPPAATGEAVRALRRKMDRMAQRGYPRVGNAYAVMHELCALRGFENTMMDLYDRDPEWLKLLDLIVEYSCGCARQAVAAGAEFIIIGDDWGTQESLYCRPGLWRELFKPRYARIVENAKAEGALCYFHSDGHIADIIPDMLEIGVDIVNPQLSCHDWSELRAAFGGRGCNAADLDRQHTLVFGSPEEIREHIRQVVEFFGKAEGGLIVHAELSPNMSWEQVMAVLDGYQTCARYYGG